MSIVRFELQLGAQEVGWLDMPIEVRRPDLRLVAHVLCSQAVELDPGTYFVSTRLPSGLELSQRVRISKRSRPQTVTLTPAAAESSPDAWQAVQHYLGRQAPGQRYEQPAVLGLEAALPQLTLRILSGNVLTGTLQETQQIAQPQGTGDGTARIDVQASDVLMIAQLLQPGQPAVNVALPVGGGQGCSIFLTRVSNQRVTIDVYLSNTEADLLLRYRERGMLQQAIVASTSDSLSAERLLLLKGADPVAAAVGAYTLLRLGDLERLHTWAQNLYNRFEWLPDGAAILGEHLARAGQHREALAALLEIEQRGLPLFADGLSFAIDRLRLYASAGERYFPAAQRERAQGLVAELQRFASFVDFTRALLTWTGDEPASPDAAVLAADISVYNGLDVRDYVG
jgi:hypothetical protein